PRLCGASFHQFRVAVLALHGPAHPDVQLDLPTRSGLPIQCCGGRPGPGDIDALHERPGHLRAISRPQEAQVVRHFHIDHPSMKNGASTAGVHLPSARAIESLGAGGFRSDLQRSTSKSSAIKAEVRGLDFHYGGFRALKDVSMQVHANEVTALIGPSGCGKSTFLRCFNRMHDLYPGSRYGGEIRLYPDDVDLLAPDVDPVATRIRIGMVFQKPNPFPKSIFENVAYGPRILGEKRRGVLEDTVEKALRDAGLWDEVKDRLDAP